MKLISCIVFSVILAPLVFCVPLPQSQSQSQGATSAQPMINAQTVNGGIAFTQQFMQLLSMLFNNFNSIVPRFVNLFTGQNAGAAAGGQSIPSLSNIPGLPSLPSIQASPPSMQSAHPAMQPGLTPVQSGLPPIQSGFPLLQTGQRPQKFNNQPTAQAITPRDTELNPDIDSNDIINDSVDILSL